MIQMAKISSLKLDVYFRSFWLYAGWRRMKNRESPLSFIWADFPKAPLQQAIDLGKISTDEETHTVVHDVTDTQLHIETVAQNCFKKNGFWPLSFSYPLIHEQTLLPQRRKMLSTIIPGVPYSFNDQTEYEREYQNSYFAVTHKKGGWDCFRHLEIMAAGAIPLMIDIDELPEFSMVHYPKASFKMAIDANLETLHIPAAESQKFLFRFFQENLTSKAMAQYILKSTGLQGAERILFIDENLGRRVDYLSIFTLIGLKQLLGKDCTSVVPTPYLYEDWRGEAAELYGRGFGYTRILDPGVKERNWPTLRLKRMKELITQGKVDAVVFGSIMRNYRIFRELQPFLDPTRTLLINGEDLPPTSETLDYLKGTGCHIFVRSIE